MNNYDEMSRTEDFSMMPTMEDGKKYNGFDR